jgi:DNA invertase Pin-like site-specific DNA recombinase
MKFVAYYRVSTKAQGVSGLGLDAQNECVVCRVEAQGGEVIGEFTDVESGKNDQRPQLEAALELAKKHNATLIIAKLDRLSRSVAFIMKLHDSGVRFEACDLPNVNTLTVGMFATFAQWEREKIADRTKAALKARREKTGEWRVDNLSDAARAKAYETNARKAVENVNNRRAIKVIEYAIYNAKEQGVRPSLRFIAHVLNLSGHVTSQGSEFTAMQVSRLMKRAKIEI